MTRARAAARTTFRSLRIRNFRLLFVGQMVSQVGTWMQMIALEWLVLRITDSGLAIGLVAAFQFTPVLLFGAWAGVVIDRVNKRKLLYVTQSAATVLAALIGVLALASDLSVGVVYVLAAALGIVTAFDNPARKAIVTETVVREEIPNAVSLNSAAMNASRIVGPALAGVVITALSPAWCFLANAISYVGVLIALVMMRDSEMYMPEVIPRAKGQIREGMHYVRRNAELWVPFVMVTLVATFAFNYRVVLPLMATRNFHSGAGIYTVLYSLMAVGSLCGTLFVAHRATIDNRFLTLTAFLATLAIVALVVSPTVLTAAAACLVIGATSMAFMSGANAALQLYATPNMRGRVMALYSVVFLGSTPIGGPIVGWISQAMGARTGAAIGAVAAGLAVLMGVRSLRKPQPVATVDGAGEVELVKTAGRGERAPSPASAA